MELSPREKDKLLIFTAALLAERRRARARVTADREQRGRRAGVVASDRQQTGSTTSPLDGGPSTRLVKST